MVTSIYCKTTLILCIIIVSLSECDSRRSSRSSKTTSSHIISRKRDGMAKQKHNVAKVVQTTAKSTMKSVKTQKTKHNKQLDKQFNRYQNSSRRNDNERISVFKPKPETEREQILRRVREPTPAEEMIKEQRIRFLATRSLTLQNVTNDRMELLINQRLSSIYKRTPPTPVNIEGSVELAPAPLQVNRELRIKKQDPSKSSISGRRDDVYKKEIYDSEERKEAESTKILYLHQQWIYMAEDRIRDLQGFINDKKGSVRFKMGMIFKHLDELIYQIREAWTFMRRHWGHANKSGFPYIFPGSDGYVLMWHQLMYYSNAVRRYLDIVYLTDRLAMVFERYYAIKMQLAKEYTDKH